MSGRTLKLFLCVLTAAMALALLMARLFPVDVGASILYSLGDVSAILFGVFGVWLGLCYKPGIATGMYGLKDDSLKNSARSVKRSYEVFRVVFHGVVISSTILVFSMFSRTFVPLAKTCPYFQRHPYWLKFAFFTVVLTCMLMQAYSILISIAPMRAAKKEMKTAHDEAEGILKL